MITRKLAFSTRLTTITTFRIRSWKEEDIEDRNLSIKNIVDERVGLEINLMRTLVVYRYGGTQHLNLAASWMSPRWSSLTTNGRDLGYVQILQPFVVVMCCFAEST